MMRSWTLALAFALVFLACAASAQSDLPPGLTIEGYPDQQSLAPGDELALHTSTSAAEYAVTITRFGSKEPAHIQANIPGGGFHPIPENASSHGCNWPITFRLKIPADWKTGYYSITMLARDSGGKFVARNRRTAEADAFFVLRPAEPGKNSKILLQLATNTYNAYTNWGGGSLYGYHGRANLQGHRVSFQRPQSSQIPNWEAPLTAWCEKNNIALDFATNLDLEQRPELLKNYKLVLSVGHDEYWSAAMRDNLEAYIAGGGNVAFFSGNTCCWQVRTEDKGQGLTCWKQNFNMDPVFKTDDRRTLSTLWSSHLVKRPENTLTGVGFLWGGYHLSHGQFMDGKGAFKVHHPEHWIFAGTNLKRDEEFGAKHTIVGYECDGCELSWKDGLPTPTHKDGTPETFEVLATCPAKWEAGDCEWYDQWERGRVGNACLGVYTRGGTVFTCGSTDWAHGLRGGDEVTERITRNILERLGQ